MGFNWGGLVSTATGGLYSPGGGKNKMPKVPKEEKMSLQKVGANKQAGGGQIHFTEEKMMPDRGPAPKMKPINPGFNRRGAAGSYGSGTKPRSNRAQAAAQMLRKLRDDALGKGSDASVPGVGKME